LQTTALPAETDSVTTSFHEATHAVIAVILGMSDVQAAIEQKMSGTGIPISG
jgi:hypothetical protein